SSNQGACSPTIPPQTIRVESSDGEDSSQGCSHMLAELSNSLKQMMKPSTKNSKVKVRQYPGWSIINDAGSFYLSIGDSGVKATDIKGLPFGKLIAARFSSGANLITLKFENQQAGKEVNRLKFSSRLTLTDVLEKSETNRQFLNCMADCLGIDVPPSKRKRTIAEVLDHPNKICKSVADKIQTSKFEEKFKGEFTVPIDTINNALPAHRVRELNESWVNVLYQRLIANNTRLSTILPVVALWKDQQMIPTDRIDPSKLNLYLLGGHHITTAMRKVRQLFPTEILGTVTVHIYMGLDVEEARAIANDHNSKMATFKLTFQDRCRQARDLFLKNRDIPITILRTKLAQHFGTIESKLLKEESMTVIIAVSRLQDEEWARVEEAFTMYEARNPNGSIPQKFFQRITSNSVDREIRRQALQMASTGPLHNAESWLNLKQRQTQLIHEWNEISQVTWEEAVNRNIVTLDSLNEFCDEKWNVSTSRSFHKFVNSQGQADDGDIDVDISITVDGQPLSDIHLSAKFQKLLNSQKQYIKREFKKQN
ncbi:unnamed protein product, partial [Owenia fusiformis]